MEVRLYHANPRPTRRVRNPVSSRGWSFCLHKIQILPFLTQWLLYERKMPMLTPQHIQEGLSRAYVTAMAHMAGMNCANSDHVRILQNGRRCESGDKIDCQLNAIINMDIRESKIYFPLEVKNCNDLVEVDVGTPRIRRP